MDRVKVILQAYKREKPIVVIDVDKCIETEKQKIIENINECKKNKNIQLQRNIINKAQRFNLMTKIFDGKEAIDGQMLEEELNKNEESKIKGEILEETESLKNTQTLGSETLEEQEETGGKLDVAQVMTQQIRELENKQEKAQKGN